MKPAYTLFVKTGPACNAGCISCPSGRKMPGDTEAIPLMKPDMFGRILDHVLSQGKIVAVVLHYYNEPTLNPHMPLVVREAKARSIETRMSTNGSRPEMLLRCYEQGIDNLIFSVSGFTQPIHERSHHGVDIEIVKKSMREIASYRDKHFPRNYIKAGWHDYAYNRHEQDRMRRFCDSIGVHFDPYQTSVLPLNIVTKRFYELQNHDDLPELPPERDLFTKLPEAKQLCEQRRHYKCIYQEGMFAVDGNGMISLCPADISCAENNNTRASIFSLDLAKFNNARRTDPWCLRCKAVGGQAYGMQKYRTPLTFKHEAMRIAEDIYRALGIGARFPALSKWLGRRLYERPRKAA